MISDISPQLIRFSGIAESVHNLYCLHKHFVIYHKPHSTFRINISR